MTSLLKTSLLPLVAALVLAGCAGAPFTPAAAPAAPVAFKEDGAARFANVGPAEAQPRGAWWTVFSDPVLDDLVLRAAANNTDLQQAAARVQAARALLRDAQADLLPQVNASLGASRATIQPGLGAAPGQAANLGTTGLAASWEPDFFGKLTKAKNAAALDAQSREAALQSTRLVVQSDVAQAYFELRALDAEREIVRQTVAAYADTLRLTERRYQAGDVAELDLARVQAEVAATNSQALALDRERALHEHALAVLLGELPTQFALAPADWNGALPGVPAGVPSTVLARRPDVASAQLAMQAAEARAGVARLACSPMSRSRPTAAMRPPTSATCSSGRRGPGASARCCRCRCSTAAAARPASRRPTRSGTSPRPPTASRCWARSATSRISSRRCACCPTRPARRRWRWTRRRGRPCCPTRATATGS